MIRAVKAKFESKMLRGPYGKHMIVQACYGAVADLAGHGLGRLIRRQLAKRGSGNGAPDALIEGLISQALPELQRPVVSNWADVIRFAQDHHIRRDRVRSFLYVMGGINASAVRYRATKTRDEHQFEPDPPVARNRPVRKMPDGMNRLFD
jgi:hypothetical protein